MPYCGTSLVKQYTPRFFVDTYLLTYSLHIVYYVVYYIVYTIVCYVLREISLFSENKALGSTHV